MKIYITDKSCFSHGLIPYKVNNKLHLFLFDKIDKLLEESYE